MKSGSLLSEVVQCWKASVRLMNASHRSANPEAKAVTENSITEASEKILSLLDVVGQQKDQTNAAAYQVNPNLYENLESKSTVAASTDTLLDDAVRLSLWTELFYETLLILLENHPHRKRLMVTQRSLRKTMDRVQKTQ